jgi:hypothetical protein
VKRVLFDENMPRRLRRELANYEVRTVQEEGWSGLKNGELLRAAQDRFDVLVTGDKRLQFQQNIAAFKIAVVVVSVASIAPASVRSILPRIREAIEQARPGTVTVAAG